MDCAYFGGWPVNSDLPAFLESGVWLGEEGDMGRFCMNRHLNGTINGVFLNLVVRKVGLKELWKLKWHRRYDLNFPAPKWPRWMVSFKDYHYTTERRRR